MSTAVRFSLASLAVLTIASGPARADAPGDKWLADVDAAQQRAATQSLQYDVVLREPGKPDRKLALTLKIKGDRRLLEFTAPADMRGTKLLELSPTQMYVYLPAFGKVRRITSQMNLGLMGLTFAPGDFAPRFADRYTATVAAESPTEVKLTAVPKAGTDAPYGRIELTVARDPVAPTEIRYFDAAGAHLKTETRAAHACQGGVCAAAERKMVDHQRGDAATALTRTAWQVDEAMPDELFSKRSLEK